MTSSGKSRLSMGLEKTTVRAEPGQGGLHCTSLSVFKYTRIYAWRGIVSACSQVVPLGGRYCLGSCHISRALDTIDIVLDVLILIPLSQIMEI